MIFNQWVMCRGSSFQLTPPGKGEAYKPFAQIPPGRMQPGLDDNPKTSVSQCTLDHRLRSQHLRRTRTDHLVLCLCNYLPGQPVHIFFVLAASPSCRSPAAPAPASAASFSCAAQITPRRTSHLQLVLPHLHSPAACGLSDFRDWHLSHFHQYRLLLQEI